MGARQIWTGNCLSTACVVARCTAPFALATRACRETLPTCGCEIERELLAQHRFGIFNTSFRCHTCICTPGIAACQLGHGSSGSNARLVPKRVESLRKFTVVGVAAGTEHTAVVTLSGNVRPTVTFTVVPFDDSHAVSRPPWCSCRTGRCMRNEANEEGSRLFWVSLKKNTGATLFTGIYAKN